MKRFVAFAFALSIACNRPKPDAVSTAAEETDSPSVVSSASSASSQKSDPGASARTGAEATLLRMVDAACNERAPDFWRLIDRDKVAVAMGDHIGKKLDAQGKRAAGNFGRNNSRAIADEALKDWDKEIGKGRDGVICKWQVASTTITTVRVKRPSGAHSIAIFEQRPDGEWIMVSFLVE